MKPTFYFISSQPRWKHVGRDWVQANQWRFIWKQERKDGSSPALNVPCTSEELAALSLASASCWPHVCSESSSARHGFWRGRTLVKNTGQSLELKHFTPFLAVLTSFVELSGNSLQINFIGLLANIFHQKWHEDKHCCYLSSCAATFTFSAGPNPLAELNNTDNKRGISPLRCI